MVATVGKAAAAAPVAARSAEERTTGPSGVLTTTEVGVCGVCGTEDGEEEAGGRAIGGGGWRPPPPPSPLASFRACRLRKEGQWILNG